MEKNLVVLPNLTQIDSSKFGTRAQDPESTASFVLCLFYSKF